MLPQEHQGHKEQEHSASCAAEPPLKTKEQEWRKEHMEMTTNSYWVKHNFSPEVLASNPVLSGKWDDYLRKHSKRHTWILFDLHSNTQGIGPSQGNWKKDPHPTISDRMKMVANCWM